MVLGWKRKRGEKGGVALSEVGAKVLKVMEQLSGSDMDVSVKEAQDLIKYCGDEDGLLNSLKQAKKKKMQFDSFAELSIWMSKEQQPKAEQKEEEMSWEQLTGLYPDVGRVLSYMSENPDLFMGDEIAVTVRSLYELVKLADTCDDALKFLKQFVKKKMAFETFNHLTLEIKKSAEKKRARAQRKLSDAKKRVSSDSSDYSEEEE